MDRTTMATGTWRRKAMLRISACTVAFAIGLCGLTPAQAQDDARRILKSMSDYVTGLPGFSISFDTSIEVVTTDLQKLQFTSSGQMQMTRPDKLRAARRGGYSDVELVFDGKVLTMHDRHRGEFAQIDLAGSIEALIERLRGGYGVEAPGADLLLPRIYDDLIADVIDAKHVGHGVVNGVDCEHLAFRNADTDWQIWVELGARPFPRKYVITSKTLAGAPQYTLTVRDWKTEAAAGEAFAFKAPPAAKKIDPKALAHIDEVPMGVVPGGVK